MALIMALGMLMVLTIALTTVIFVTTSGARDAKRTNAGQRAYSIAEAGINSALAQLATHYPTFSPAGSSTWVSGPSVTYPSGVTCNPATTTTDCVSWTGTFSGNDWTLTGTGTVPNPTGGSGKAAVRTVSASLHVSSVPASFQPFGIFSGDPQAQCTDLGGNISVDVPIYVKNCLNMHGTFSGTYAGATADAKVWDAPPYTVSGGVSSSGQTVTVNVLHNLDLSGNGATIGVQTGTIDHRVKSVSVGSCSGPCTGGSKQIFAQTYNNSPDNTLSLPTLDAASVYSGTNWGGATCSTTGGASNPFDTSPPRNNSGGVLFPGSGSYSCSLTDAQGQTHSISYTASSKALTISNSWYVDGDLAFPNATINYTGRGTIFVNGVVSMSSQAKICASVTCIDWDPTVASNPNLLIVALNASSVPAATSFSMNGQAQLEANAWAIGNGTGDASPTPPTATCATGAFSSQGGAYLGGSVWTQNGCASITGGGVLHSAVALPSGSPVSTQYDLLSPISGYKGG